ncbi:tail protein X [Anaeroselena agilis]|uniref:Tail protein X n=1 Tax=Anaeroselena agilis TaxID=3063788 RepID=A0ABU3NYF1_9FIRM|nr:tail protein X [Selenomonadales bacterium 4137-cl]
MSSSYTTKQGDMWDTIAYNQYGSEYKMQDLIAANPQHAATVIFPAGVVLTIPDKTATTATNLPPWKKAST